MTSLPSARALSEVVRGDNGLIATPRAGLGGGVSVITMVLGFSVAMAPATGIAASSHAIAQLGELDDDGRRRIGRVTLWLMFVIQGALADHCHKTNPRLASVDDYEQMLADSL